MYAHMMCSLLFRCRRWQLRKFTCTTTHQSYKMRWVWPFPLVGVVSGTPHSVCHVLVQVLAHRLGLIPLKVDPRKFEMLPPCKFAGSPLVPYHPPLYSYPVEEGATFPLPAPEYSKHMLEFRLKVKCTRSAKSSKTPQGLESYQHTKGESCDVT